MTASKLRMYLDKNKAHTSAKLDEVVVGVRFAYKAMEYTVTSVDGSNVSMTGLVGFKTRTTIVPISEITKSGSEYRLIG